jgi:hypothetical protein
MSEPTRQTPPPQPMPAEPRTYSHSAVVRVCVWAFLAMVLAGMGLIVLGWATQGGVTEALPPDLAAKRPAWGETTLGTGAMAALLFLLGILALWLGLMAVGFSRRVRVDERGISRLGLFGSRRIDWADVTELTIGGSPGFAERVMGTKLFVEGRDGTLVTFTNRLNGVGELVEIIEARTHLAFGTPEGEAILPIADEEPDQKGSDKP